MPLPQDGITRDTPLGVTAGPDGSTLRTWAPNASAVYAIIGGDLACVRNQGWSPAESNALQNLGDGTWGGFVPGLGVGQAYLFWIAGAAGAGPKRDPYARELGAMPAFPDCPCMVTDPHAYPWQATDWCTPAFSDLVIYQLHVGTWWAQDGSGNDVLESRGGTFLDVAARLPYLQALGITAIQLLPIQEFVTWYSLGYNGVDYFSPETDYQTTDQTILQAQIATANALFNTFGKPGVTAAQLLEGCDQLRCLIDLAHLHGIAVILDLVYNHAGGGFDDASLWFYDRQTNGDADHSLYFTNQSWAGGQIFAYWNEWVQQYLIDNATMFLREYRIDGIRYDEVRVIENNGGRAFCQSLTNTVRFTNPSAIQIAEYWNSDRANAVTPAPDGLGFDAELGDGLRDTLRALLGQLAGGAGAAIDLDAVATALVPRSDIPDAWRLVNCLENQDITYNGHDNAARIATLADTADHQSWFARSRARAVTALLLTAPGIPMLFMGQEMLEDKLWTDDRANTGELIWWDGLTQDQVRADFHRCITDLLALRRAQPALRDGNIRISCIRDDDRVLVMHRWRDDPDQDVIVVVNFSEQSHYSYDVGLPWPGTWYERFNSDVYDGNPNPNPVGNGGFVVATGDALDGFVCSAALAIPPNGVLVLGREG